jgi:hypothetical protein
MAHDLQERICGANDAGKACDGCLLRQGVCVPWHFHGDEEEGHEMESGMISKIQKAKRYAEERDRIAFDAFRVTFKGDHDTYHVAYESGHWSCQCQFFLSHGLCSHTMAMERILDPMLRPQREAEGVSTHTA